MTHFIYSVLVCMFISLPALAENSYGIFMVVKGDIKVQHGTGAPLAAKVGTKILSGETVFSGADSRAKIVMNDRNVFYVSPQTKLTIEKYSDGKDGVKNVEMRLDEGRVLNNVQQKYDGSKEKFLIKTPTAVAGVRGTSFITSFDKATQVTEVMTQTGIVALTSIDKKGVELGTVMVNKGEGSKAGAMAPPAAPKPVPADQMKKAEGDVTGSKKEGAAAPAPTDNTRGSAGGSGEKKGDGGVAAGDTTPKGDGLRLNDKKDTAPDAVDKAPAGAPARAPAPGVGVAPQPIKPGTVVPPAQVTDAIRNKTDKTKVNINIKPPTNAP